MSWPVARSTTAAYPSSSRSQSARSASSPSRRLSLGRPRLAGGQWRSVTAGLDVAARRAAVVRLLGIHLGAAVGARDLQGHTPHPPRHPRRPGARHAEGPPRWGPFGWSAQLATTAYAARSGSMLGVTFA